MSRPRPKPKLAVASAEHKMAELTGVVTVGPETAAKLGIEEGAQIDLGRIAYFHRNPIKRWWGTRKIRRSILHN